MTEAQIRRIVRDEIRKANPEGEPLNVELTLDNDTLTDKIVVISKAVVAVKLADDARPPKG